MPLGTVAVTTDQNLGTAACRVAQALKNGLGAELQALVSPNLVS